MVGRNEKYLAWNNDKNKSMESVRGAFVFFRARTMNSDLVLFGLL